jgi:tyrosyl-tRNA synthetase
MSKSVFEILHERGFIAQLTHEDKINDILENEKVTFYIGFDPTADSLHVGHFIPLMVMSHMQKAGHKPIAIIGGGTTMVGDPTGKTDMRKMLTLDEIDENAERFKLQISKFINFEDNKAIMINNADWLLKLNYVDFLREIGVHFSVNRMLTADCFKSRLEKGLNFIEFNYMLMQSYDFLKLFQDYDCTFQVGGDDQWSNILGGIDLIRRVESKESYGITVQLLTTGEGKKMGKTENGALWLNPEKTTPYEFYQYWRNVHDDDVIKCLKLLTFLPIDEINELAKLEGNELNKVKEILAYEVTKLVHNEEEAKKADTAAKALFSGGNDDSNMPTTKISKNDLSTGLLVIDLMITAKLISSKSEGRRLIEQGGLSIDGEKVTDFGQILTLDDFNKNELVIKKGKKVFHKIIIN